MKGKRYTEEQIAFALRQHEAGTSVQESTRKMGIAELQRLKQFED
jgi:putative transposase